MTGDLVFLVIAGGVFSTLALLIVLFSNDKTGRKAATRLAKVRERHSSSKNVIAEAQMRRIVAARDTRLDSVFSGFLPNKAELKKRLQQTGKSWGVGQYVVATLGIGVVLTLALISAGMPVIMGIAVGVLMGLAVPHATVGILIKRRLKDFNHRFPDAIELLTRGLRSGLPVGESISVVGQEVPGTVGQEFRSVSDKVRIGRTMDLALQETADRIGTPEFQFFVITLAIQRETGGNLAETLSNLADVLRKRMQMKLKIRAMSSESKASAYIVGSLPFIVFAMIYTLDPEYLGGFFTDTRLMVIGAGAFVWMSIGAFIMARMVSFEI
ncbi:type II secretion system F family protein [Pacificimonas sp. ICDLI1SI03]